MTHLNRRFCTMRRNTLVARPNNDPAYLNALRD